jgi:hypothetical protein
MKKKNIKTGKRAPELKRGKPVRVQRLVSSRREEQALEALVALALRHDQEGITDAEIKEYMSNPEKLTQADAAALKRARPGLLKALLRELKPDVKRFMAAWGKPANE